MKGRKIHQKSLEEQIIRSTRSGLLELKEHTVLKGSETTKTFGIIASERHSEPTKRPSIRQPLVNRLLWSCNGSRPTIAASKMERKEEKKLASRCFAMVPNVEGKGKRQDVKHFSPRYQQCSQCNAAKSAVISRF